MDSPSKTSQIFVKSLLLLFLLIVALVCLIKPPLTSSRARTQEEQKERVFEDAIPSDAPIKIKIKKEKERSFKDLKDESWVREFELEVKNTAISQSILFI